MQRSQSQRKYFGPRGPRLRENRRGSAALGTPFGDGGVAETCGVERPPPQIPHPHGVWIDMEARGGGLPDTRTEAGKHTVGWNSGEWSFCPVDHSATGCTLGPVRPRPQRN